MLAKETAALSGLWSGKDEVFLQQHRGFCASKSCCYLAVPSWDVNHFLYDLGHQQYFAGII
jgi:hypothetical protein